MSEEHHGVWPQSWDLHGCIMVCLSNSVTSSFVIISSEKQPDPLVMAIREFSVLWGTSARVCSHAYTHTHTQNKGKDAIALGEAMHYFLFQSYFFFWYMCSICHKRLPRWNYSYHQRISEENVGLGGFPCGSAGKESTSNLGGSLGWEDRLEKGTATHSSWWAWHFCLCSPSLLLGTYF